MNSRDYWAKRESEALKHYISDEKEYSKQIQQIYSDMLTSINGQINEFYGKYATAEGITIAEAKKRVSKLDIAEYERKAEKYVKEKNFSKQANEEMRIYNATMKINRLEMLKANIGLEMIAGHDELDKFMAGILKGRTMEELERQAGILGKTVLNNAKKANAIVNGSFKAAKVGSQSTFSDRIWQYQDLMREDLGRLLQTGLIQGKNPRAIAKDLRKYWYGNDPATGGGATYCMERLMRTELARVQTEAQKQSFERNGFSEYMFIANASCCADCQALNGKHFKVEKMMPGDNAPPLHPHCRCSVAAYEDNEEYEAWLDYLDKGGTTAEWNETGRAAWEKAQGKSTLPKPKTATAAKEQPKAETTVDPEKEARQFANDLEKISDVNELKAKLAKLDEEFENATTLNDMIKAQLSQDAVAKRIEEVLKEQKEAEKKKKIASAEKSIIASGMVKNANLEGCDLESAKAIVSTVKKIQSKYSDVSFGKIAVSKANMKGERFTGSDSLGKIEAQTKITTIRNGKRITTTQKTTVSGIVFNGKYFGDSAMFKSLLEKSHESGFHANGSIEGVVAHELGHAVCGEYQINELDIHHEVLTMLGLDYQKAYGGTSESEYKAKTHISNYGDTAINEWFAECFADYYTNSKPKKISIAAVEAFNKLIGK